MDAVHTDQQRWSMCLQIIQANLSQQQYATWFAPISFESFDKERSELTLCVPSPFIVEYIEAHFLDLIRAVLKRVYGEGTRLIYNIKVDATNGITTTTEGSNTPSKPAPATNVQSTTLAPQPLQQLDSQLIARYTFDNFVAGVTNKLPLTVGLSIAQNPKQVTFNPFFLYGPSGCGKTHLVNAIGGRIKKLYPEKRVLYVSAHLFQTQFVESTLRNTINDFIAFYQSIDVLIIDDVQEFAAQEKTQLAFFHIFNHLHQNGRQLILTCDRPPVALRGMEERLLTRFKWGLLAELERPDFELRRDILLRKIHRDGLHFSDGVVDYIASVVDHSVRDLEGVLNSLMAYSVVHNCEIDVALAERVITHTIGAPKHRDITLDVIIEQACETFATDPTDVLSKSRKADVVLARQVVMFLAQKLTGLSTTKIGVAIGRRNHATVVHSCQCINERLSTDSAFRAQLEKLEGSLKHV